MRRKRAGQFITFGLVSRVNGAPLLGVSPAVYLTLDDADQVSPTYAVVEKGHGQYQLRLTEAETDATTVAFIALVGNAVLAEKTIYTTEAP